MDSKQTPGMVELARLAGEFVEAVAEQEAQVLHMMQAGLDGLAKPADKPAAAAPEPPGEAADDAFDNMPV